MNRNNPICYIATITAALILALMLFANHHMVQTKAMFDDLPEIRGELVAMESEINELCEVVTNFKHAPQVIDFIIFF